MTTMDPQTKVWMDKLREYREQLSEVDTCFAPNVAAEVQADLCRHIENLEGLLHAKVADLDGIIRLGDHRMTYSYRMDREDILRVLGVDVEEPERDTPRLNALMKGNDDIFKTVDAAQQDFKPSLETMLFLGGDKALKAWVDGLSPMQMGALLVMGPRLVELVREKYSTLESMQGPGDQIQYRKFTDRGPLLNNRKPGTEFLNDTEPGSFDD